MLDTVEVLCSNTVRVYQVKPGLWCALVGPTASGLHGWGHTPADALADLAYLCLALHWVFDPLLQSSEPIQL